MIEQVGGLIHFLTPYIPYFNPILDTFSKVNTEMKHMEASRTSIMDIETITLSAFLWLHQRIVKVGFLTIAYVHNNNQLEKNQCTMS